MNKRIRYSKMADGTLVSMRVIKGSDNKEFRSYVLPSGTEGYIEYIGVGNSDVIKSTSPHRIKIALKEELEKHGCAFAKETRGK